MVPEGLCCLSYKTLSRTRADKNARKNLRKPTLKVMSRLT